jgi:peroxiredoxin (alkyl hydroperoxide reductase subunit C)
MEELNQEYLPMPRIGDKAPAFEASTTQGRVNFPADFAGSWTILFSHPSDFTPICTSEFVVFASMQEKFAEANCKLLGLSIDGLNSHIAWLRTIRERIEFNGIKNADVKFPLIDDISMSIAKKYGMIMPGQSETKAVRAVFFIDPKGIIRAIIYYPMSLGRNFDELYRVILALQTTDEFGYSTPADWRPGSDVMVSPPVNTTDAEKRVKEEGYVCQDWFFCFKKLDKETILKKILKK